MPLAKRGQVDHVRRAPGGRLHRRGRLDPGRCRAGLRPELPPQLREERPGEDEGQQRQHQDEADQAGQAEAERPQEGQRPPQQIEQQAADQPRRGSSQKTENKAR